MLTYLTPGLRLRIPKRLNKYTNPFMLDLEDK